MSDINIIETKKQNAKLLGQLYQINKQLEALRAEKTKVELLLHEGKIPLDLFSITKGWTYVVYAFPNNGWGGSKSKVSDTLTLGKRYRVLNIEIGGSSSEVEVYSDKLNKMVWINSVMFCQYHKEGYHN